MRTQKTKAAAPTLLGSARLRLPLAGVSLLLVLIGMWAGLVRIGWGLPPLVGSLPEAHGGLMVGGFLGTLIGLERAVALRRQWAYGAPLLSAVGGLALLSGLRFYSIPAGAALLALSALWLVAVYVALLRVQAALFTATMAAGAASLLVGDALWAAGFEVYQVVLWWGAFLILTIAGERLELSRMLRLGKPARFLFLVVQMVLASGLILSVFQEGPGARLFGMGLVGLGLWLLRNDLARRTIRQTGLTRYMAACLLLGYMWLIVGGIIGIIHGLVDDTPYYDALLHSMFLGFVFSMIFAHAPVILPAVTGIGVPFAPRFYWHLALLHASLALRVGCDLLGWVDGTSWGGMLNVVALLLFMGNTAIAVRAGSRRRANRSVDAARLIT